MVSYISRKIINSNIKYSALSDVVKDTLKQDLTRSQTKHLEDLGFGQTFFNQDYIKNLRIKFVVEASEWLAGKYGSKQNEKSNFGYNDEEWEWIWSTMIEDGAWAVPALTDREGNVQYSVESYSGIRHLVLCWIYHT